MLASLQPGDKGSLAGSAFGTTYPETRQRTIEAINRKIADFFRKLTIRAWTSRIVIKRMAARGERSCSCSSIAAIAREGFTHVVVQQPILLRALRWKLCGVR